jgi:PIN domain nuclease of toxin-antitoxin system
LKLLLDTHALIWWLSDDPSLSKAAYAAIADSGNDVFVSAVSAMEVTTKVRVGKLPQGALLAGAFEREIAEEGFLALGISTTHAVLGGSLPFTHKDPFDRLLIAQAILDDLTLVSNEQVFDETGVSRLW